MCVHEKLGMTGKSVVLQTTLPLKNNCSVHVHFICRSPMGLFHTSKSEHIIKDSQVLSSFTQHQTASLSQPPEENKMSCCLASLLIHLIMPRYKCNTK